MLIYNISRVDNQVPCRILSRYVVHKKLVSFMAPYSDSNWTEQAVQELFTSLFGNYHKAGETSNEADEEKATGTEMKVM